MDLNFIKNPIFLAIIAGVLAYLYLYYENMQNKDKTKTVDYKYPLIIAAITFAISYGIFGFNSSKAPELIPEIIESQKGGFTDNVTDSFGSNTYRLIGKNNIKLPQTDVFIDLAHF